MYIGYTIPFYSIIFDTISPHWSTSFHSIPCYFYFNLSHPLYSILLRQNSKIFFINVRSLTYDCNQSIFIAIINWSHLLQTLTPNTSTVTQDTVIGWWATMTHTHHYLYLCSLLSHILSLLSYIANFLISFICFSFLSSIANSLPISLILYRQLPTLTLPQPIFLTLLVIFIRLNTTSLLYYILIYPIPSILFYCIRIVRFSSLMSEV
jgi:hypothetical protein